MKRYLTLSPLKISLLISIVTIGLYFTAFPFFEMVELNSLDLRFRARGIKKPSPNIAIVSIDEKSLDEMGRWPWPRNKIAQLLDVLKEYEVNSVGFDIVFAEPEHNPEKVILNRIKDKIPTSSSAYDHLISYLDGMEKNIDNDTLLANSIARFEKVVLGYFFHPNDANLKHISEEKRPPSEDILTSAYTAIEYLSQSAVDIPFTEENFSVENNIKVLSRAANGFGYFNIFPDFDGTIRWAPLIMKYKDGYFPPLSLQLVRQYLNNPPLKIVAAEYGVDKIMLGNKIIPTDESGRLLINYRGGEKTFPHYSVYDVIEKKIAASKLKDKIVLIGATAIGIYDIRATPFENVYPGVEIHANIIDNILTGDFLYRPGWTFFIDVAIILIAGIILGLVLPKMSPYASALTVLTFLAAFFYGNYYMFVNSGIWLNIVYPSISILATYMAITIFHYMAEEKEKRKVKKAFQYYLTSSVVNEVLKNPEKLKLGGEKKELSVLFSDIRGFTSISEKMTPEELVHLLNEYLTTMTDIVFSNDGLLDKYIGDAVMAVFGAPIDQPDHASRACKTALEMIRNLEILNEEWQKRGIPKIKIGVGISSGPMVVGNMGSERRFDYTVMGDTVNLGSRLESITKFYGVSIILSEESYLQVKDNFVCRELDIVKVSGKERPSKIYELLIEQDQDANHSVFAKKFDEALELYRGMKWQEAIEAFSGILESNPEDPVSEVYIKRCHLLSKTPPETDWQGVFTMKTK